MLSQKALSPESGRLGADHIHRPHTTAKDLSMAATTASTATPYNDLAELKQLYSQLAEMTGYGPTHS